MIDRIALLAALVAAAGCASRSEAPAAPAHPVDSVRKVIDSLGAEIGERRKSEPYRDLPVVVRAAAATGTSFEPIVVEFLRTRLVERGVPVDAACVTRCMEVTLQEFAVDAPRASLLSAGQVLAVAGGNIPILGGLVRGIGEQEKEKERAARRTTGFIVTFAARDGNRYIARANIAVISSSGDQVAPEPPN